MSFQPGQSGNPDGDQKVRVIGALQACTGRVQQEFYNPSNEVQHSETLHRLLRCSPFGNAEIHPFISHFDLNVGGYLRDVVEKRVNKKAFISGFQRFLDVLRNEFGGGGGN